MIHEQHERSPLRRGKSQTRRGALSKKRACLGMRPRADRAAGVVQEKREIKNKRVREFLEERAVGTQLRVFRFHHLVELVDTNQGMLIRRVTMEKFMLHQAGELAEFWHVTTKKVHPVHHAQHPPNLAFAGNDPVE